jgi:uncharacterized membrane protein
MFISFADKRGRRRSATAAASERPIRCLAKAISWRVTGSIDTMLLSWFFSGDLAIAAAIGLSEVVTKMLLYYLHEGLWNRIPLGRNNGLDQQEIDSSELARGVSVGWRPAQEVE